jgi:thioredoxin 2
MSEARNIVCARCGQTNRVPTDRPAARARCGACREPLFTGHPIEVDETTFDRHATRNDIPVLVDVWAPWCGPCRVMAPMFEQAAAALEPDVRLLKLNSDRAPELSARLGIRSIPTLVLVRSGKVLARTSGVMRADQIVAWARSNLAQVATGR